MLEPQIIPCLSYCLAGIMVAAKIQQNCTGTANYNSKATRQGIICGYISLVKYALNVITVNLDLLRNIL